MTHTREQITEKWDGMTPRERDAWVAKEITGAERKKKLIPCPDGIEGCAVAHYAYYPHYTTDISAAWEVVETFGHACLTKRHFDVWYCEILNDGIFVEAPSASEAICLAALVAKLTESTV